MSLRNDSLLSQTEDNNRMTQASSRDSNDEITNPCHTIGRVRSQKGSKGSTLPNTMKANKDGTLSIYTAAPKGSNRKELYTEIPFTAIHGMQTTERDECQVLGTYADGLDLCQKDLEISGDAQSLAGPVSKSFAEEVLSGRVTRPLFIATFAAAACQFLVGYNIVILNTPEKFVFPGHSTWSWSLAVSALAIGAPIGSVLAGTLSETHGRKRTLLLDVLGFLIGGIVQTFAPTLAVVTLARFILGLASGISTVLVPMYLGELAPPHLRGTLGTVNQFAYVLGILAADLLSFGLATEEGWRHLFFITVIVATLQLLLVPFVVESPRWLLMRNAHDRQARQILEDLRGCQDYEEVEEELTTYILASVTQGGESKSGPDLLSEMMSHAHVRHLFFCIVGLHAVQQLCGISAVFYYSTAFFDGIIDNPLIGTTLIGTVNVIFTYAALLLMDRCRRKSLILWSICGMLLACSAIILAQTGVFGSTMALLAVNVYVAFYEIGIGPIPWLIIAEMFEAKYVSVTISVCSQMSWVVNFIVGLVFPTMNHVLGRFTFVPFGAVLFVSFLFVWKTLPETHGKTPEEVGADIEKKLSESTEGTNEEVEEDTNYQRWQTACCDCSDLVDSTRARLVCESS